MLCDCLRHSFVGYTHLDWHNGRFAIADTRGGHGVLRRSEQIAAQLFHSDCEQELLGLLQNGAAHYNNTVQYRYV